MHCSSTNIDEIELSNAYQEIVDLDEKKPKYAKTEWRYTDDKNKLNYKSTVKWDTSDWKDTLPVMREGYTMFPLSISSSTGVPYTKDTRLAFKNSVLSFVKTLSVQALSGMSFVNELDGQTPIINNLRLLTATDIDWTECSGSELHYFGCDRSIDPNVMGDAQLVNASTTSLSQACPTSDIFCNERLSSRIAIFSHQSARNETAPYARIDPTKFQMLLCIPLKFLHPFFDQLGFPLPNCPLKIEMGLAQVTQGCFDYQAITCPSLSSTLLTVSAAGAPATQAPIPAAPLPTISIDVSVSIRGFSPGACRLYVKCVTLGEDDAKKMDAALASPGGFKKTITYLTTDIVTDTSIATTPAGRSYVRVFGEDTRRPVRVWALFPKTGTVNAADNCFPASIGTCYLQETNLKLNGDPVRKPEAYRSQRDFYNEIREYQLGSGYNSVGGSSISLNDFMNGVNPYLFDVSRHISVINNQPITFKFEGKLTEASSVAVDPIFIIERYKMAFLNITKNAVTSDTWDGLEGKRKKDD